MSIFLKIANGFKRVVFPNVCVCCGREHTEEQRQICSFCLTNRFEDGNPENKKVSSDSLLPDGIVIQHALWQFDKGGDLQNLLHQLKYERLTTVGCDLGRALGRRVQRHPGIVDLFDDHESVIVPVPLHYLKYRYRGFNQAFKLAQGFQEIWEEVPICEIDDIVRIKNTRSQTGFSLEKRLDNMQEAFRVNNKPLINNRLCVIIDDVFTTGATTFELADTLKKAGAGPVIILTVAQA
ncbi:ComF family protein [Fodinibius sp.]|uniref:ComF family protein n=1 Tax=Fodinibius sp. TaxID=1872440 RepID=UPI002ACEF397|nr:ComF family protein [Fodinibius sp.]MDZ7657892.1 ComF family protein [Fodinibius sp.]